MVGGISLVTCPIRFPATEQDLILDRENALSQPPLRKCGDGKLKKLSSLNSARPVSPGHHVKTQVPIFTKPKSQPSERPYQPDAFNWGVWGVFSKRGIEQVWP